MPDTTPFIYDDELITPPEPQVQVCPNCGEAVKEETDQYDVYKCGNSECNAKWEIKRV